MLPLLWLFALHHVHGLAFDDFDTGVSVVVEVDSGLRLLLVGQAFLASTNHLLAWA